MSILCSFRWRGEPLTKPRVARWHSGWGSCRRRSWWRCLDDAHDEGEETLSLRLWNPSGVRLAGAEGGRHDREHGPDAGGGAGVRRGVRRLRRWSSTWRSGWRPRDGGRSGRVAGPGAAAGTRGVTSRSG